MALTLYNINFTPTLGSYGTLIEYKKNIDSTWSVPSAPSNPTTLNTYPLYLEIGVPYTVRLSSESGGAGCSKKYIYLFVPTGSCCPLGYSLSGDGTYCYLIEETAATPPSASENAVAVTNAAFSMCGTKVMNQGYALDGTGTYNMIPTSVPFWINGSNGVCNTGNTSDGPLNRTGVWSTTTLDEQIVGFTFCLTVTEAKIYHIGIGFDNYGSISVDGNIVVDLPLVGPSDPFNPLSNWLIYPIFLPVGNHIIEVKGHNGTATPPNPAAIGVEIYNNTAQEILTSTGYGDLDVLFSSADYVGQPIQIGSDGIGYTCPSGYALNICDGPAVCQRFLTTPPITCL